MRKKQLEVKASLTFYDITIFAMVDVLLFVLYKGSGALDLSGVIAQSLLAFISVFTCRYAGKIYSQIWRYGGIQCYIRLLITDFVAFLYYFCLERVLPVQHIMLAKLLAFCCMNLLGALAIRMIYRYAYKCGRMDNNQGRFLRFLLRVFAGERVTTEPDANSQKIKIAIVGAGSVGVNLAEELWSNPVSAYLPRCFIDIKKEKIGRDIHNIPVISEDEATAEQLRGSGSGICRSQNG